MALSHILLPSPSMSVPSISLKDFQYSNRQCWHKEGLGWVILIQLRGKLFVNMFPFSLTTIFVLMSLFFRCVPEMGLV